MVEIHVIFPEKPSPNDKAIVAVSKPDALVFKYEWVCWLVHRQNQSVTDIQIKFSDKGATFFEDSNQAAPYEEYAEKIADETVIWGQAPATGPGQVVNKYTITGFDSSGYVVAELDPRIITDDPPAKP